MAPRILCVRFLAFLALVSVIQSCVDEELIDSLETTGHTWFWTPIVRVEKADGKAMVGLTNPLPFTNYAAPGPANPEYFKIWISSSPEGNFQAYKKVDIATTDVEIPNLINGQAYYFFVTSHRGSQQDSSAVVMTVPNVAPRVERFNANSDLPIRRLSASPGATYLAFETYDKLYFKSLNSQSANLLAANATGGKWSINNKFVYITSLDEGIYRYPSALKIVDAETATSETLVSVAYHDYYIQNPAFTPDGQRVTYLSSEGNSGKSRYDLWSLDPDTSEKVKLTHFEDVGFHIDYFYAFANSGEEAYVDGTYDVQHQHSIFKINLATQSISPVIESQWNDIAPSLSPDNSKIAFISDRSGRNELWTYDLQTSGYRQITGSQYVFDARYSNLQWVDNDQMLITVFDGENSIPVTIGID